MMKGNEEDGGSTLIEGRNEVIEALRSGRSIDRIYIQDGLHDGKLDTVRREAKKRGLRTDFVERKRLDDMSETGMHQGVIARAAAYAYAKVEDILEMALKKGEDPFIFVLDGIEDPHNLGAMIRTANVCGAHGVIIPKDRAVGLTPTVVRSSAGALNYTPVAKVTNLVRTMEDLKKRGLWFVGADMGGESMYEKDLKGPVGIVIGAEGRGLTKLVRDACDFVVSIPVKGEIESLNASVAAGVLAYEVTRQRTV
ncbi:MAG: 23S rRNA (guanosine(2251)-2'-O)-methyltransferase RlmB [Lachnospiraceae bacterium]|nr:23S rRNA (guanosine(2251)-2'-O)-methyltransferase RlmB [Lachnospiraceae bacterium]